MNRLLLTGLTLALFAGVAPTYADGESAREAVSREQRMARYSAHKQMLAEKRSQREKATRAKAAEIVTQKAAAKKD